MSRSPLPVRRGRVQPEPPPRALVAVRTYALEVVLGTLFGAIGIRAATLVLGPLEPDIARLMVAALLVWCGLLAGAVRIARLGRARIPAAVTLSLLAPLALGVVAPVVIQLALTSGGGLNPFANWEHALAKVKMAVDPTSFFGAVVWGTVIPFVLVGAPLAARRQAPLWTTAVLGACGGYLGLAATCALTTFASPVIVLGFRHALLVGMPLAVIGMGLATRRGDRPRLSALLLALAIATPVVGASLLGHSRHLVAFMLRADDGYGLDMVEEHVDHRAWSEHLSDPRPGARRRVLSALGRHGPRAVTSAPAVLHVAMHDQERTVRHQAVGALGALICGSPDDPSIWQGLIGLMVDGDRGIRHVATGIFVSHATPAAGEALVATILDAKRGGVANDPRLELIPPLGELWRENALTWDLDEVLLGAGRIHDDPVSAARFVRRTFYKISIESHLLRALRSDEPDVRRVAAHTLSEDMTTDDFTREDWRLIDAELERR